MKMRYIKRFTGTGRKAKPEYIVVLQYWDGEWIDVVPENAEWETPYDAQDYDAALKREFLRQPR